MFSLSNTQLKESKTLLAFFILIHLIALAAVWVSAVPLFIKILFSFLIILSFVWSYLDKLSFRSPTAIIRISWDANTRQMLVIQNNGEKLAVEKITERMVFPLGVYLKLKLPDRLMSYPLLILYDSCSRQDYRRLKVLVKLAKVELG